MTNSNQLKEDKEDLKDLENLENEESVRTEIISSAVNFLSDPKVQKASLPKRIQFLESKGLTNKEIELALTQVKTKKETKEKIINKIGTNHEVVSNGSKHSVKLPSLPPHSHPQSTWKDYFITSVVTGAVAYSLYGLTQTFIAPLLKWPSEEDLEAERKRLDAQFEQAFQAIETVRTDTKKLIDTVYQQNSSIERALFSLSDAIESLKSQDQARLVDVEKLWSEMETVKKLIPDAFDKSRDAQSNLLEDLQEEIRSLKGLVTRRLNSATSNGSSNDTDSANPMRSASYTSLLSKSLNANKINGGDAVPATVHKPAVPAWQLATLGNKKGGVDVQSPATESTTASVASSPAKLIHPTSDLPDASLDQEAFRN